jgi:hypothetical protein
MLSICLQTVQFIVKMWKCAGLAQEIDFFFAPNSWSLPWLVKGPTQLCTSKKECNELDLIAAQYFWLVDHNDWSMWFAISSSHIYAVPVTVLLVGLPKRKPAKLRHLILLSRVTYWAQVEMFLKQFRWILSFLPCYPCGCWFTQGEDLVPYADVEANTKPKNRTIRRKRRKDVPRTQATTRNIPQSTAVREYRLQTIMMRFPLWRLREWRLQSRIIILIVILLKLG